MLKKGTLLKIVPLNTYLSYYLYFFLTECMVCFKQRFTLDTWPYSQWAWDLCAPRWAIWAHPYLWGKFTRQSKLTEKTVKIDWKKQSKLTEKTVKIDWKQNKKSAGTLFWWHSVVFFLGCAATRDAVLPLKTSFCCFIEKKTPTHFSPSHYILLLLLPILLFVSFCCGLYNNR